MDHETLTFVHELCERCGFLSMPAREYTDSELARPRLCPAGCGQRLGVVGILSRQATPEDRTYIAFYNVLAATDWGPTADDLDLLLCASDWEWLPTDPTNPHCDDPNDT
ncbi:hypothetical protein ACIQU6_32830 [Streptomyces sp. NPDC090442]|uniref:hypothetical protein n=1 Tax=Streptomyces sp. NPDC090442 TaxID=3365962 RepID=UPI0037F6ADDE